MAVIYNDDCSSLTGWTESVLRDADVTQETYDGASCFKFYVNGVYPDTAAAYLYRTVTGFNFDNAFTLTIRTYFDNIGTFTNSSGFNFQLNTNFGNIYFGTDGLLIISDGESGDIYTEIGTNIVALDVWATWKFVYSATSGGVKTVNVYLDDILQASDVPAIRTGTEPILFSLVEITGGIAYIDSILITDSSVAPIGPLYRVDAMKALIRTQLKESSDVILTDATILQAINDGYKEVSSRAFCIEHEDTVNTVAGDRLVPFSGHRVVEVKYGTKGLLKILPTVAGHANISGNSPQYWFQWGRYVVIEPVPDAAYSLTFSISDYPSAELTLDTEYPTSLPDEFHPCIVDFACYVLSLRLCKWKQAAKYYNLYIQNLKRRKKDYIDRKAEKRTIHRIPDNVRGNMLRKEVDIRAFHGIPANVKHADGRAWAH